MKETFCDLDHIQALVWITGVFLDGRGSGGLLEDAFKMAQTLPNLAFKGGDGAERTVCRPQRLPPGQSERQPWLPLPEFSSKQVSGGP